MSPSETADGDVSVVDSVKGAFSGPGKKWIIGGALLGGGYLWWTRVRNGKTAAAGDGTGAATITPGGAAVADPVTPAGGDYSPAAGTTTRATTNGEWLQNVMAKLILPPYNRPTAATWNALQKALAGDPLTTAEISIVETAIQIEGTPPEGMPPLNMSGTGNDGTTNPSLQTPTGLRTTGPVWTDHLEVHWDPVPGAYGYVIKGGPQDVTTGPVSGVMIGGLVHNGSYFLTIASKNANGDLSPFSAPVTAHTKN